MTKKIMYYISIPLDASLTYEVEAESPEEAMTFIQKGEIEYGSLEQHDWYPEEALIEIYNPITKRFEQA